MSRNADNGQRARAASGIEGTGSGAEPLSWREVAFFLRFVRPLWAFGALSLSLSAVSVLLGSLLPLSSKVVLDFVIMGRDPAQARPLLERVLSPGAAGAVCARLDSLRAVLTALVAVSASAGLLRILQQYVVTRFQQGMTCNLQAALFDHVLRLPMDFLRRTGTGYLVARVEDDVGALQRLFSERAELLVRNVFYLVFGATIAVALSWRLTLLTLAVLPVYVAVNPVFARRIRRVWDGVMERRAEVSRDMQEALAAVEVIKLHAREDAAAERVAGRLRAAMRAYIRGMLLGFAAGQTARAVQFIATALVTLFGVREIRAGRMTVGDFVAFGTYMAYLSSPARSLATFHLGIQPVLVSLGRIRELFRRAPEVDAAADASRLVPAAARGAVAFEDVHFSYEGGPPVLRGVRFTAAPGSVTAIVGPSGGGKTTLVGLLAAFGRPSSGAVRLDGHDLRELSLRWLRQRVAFVPQEGVLFADTLANNIRYGRPDAPDEAVRAAARAAGIDAEVAGMPDGYETRVGERGTGVSIGQRQRVALARALLREPVVLVLDEPAAALDPENERLLRETLERLRGRCTVFVISHRFALIDRADRVLVMDAGRIVEEGAHGALLARGGFYRQLVEGGD